ncbi:MAG: phosphate ABC transporter permease subunit PstC [Chthoniobacteraceae bacterium]
MNNQSASVVSHRPHRDPFKGLCWLASAAVVVLIFWVAAQIGKTAWPAITQYGFGFLTHTIWNPVNDTYGVLPFLIGTAMSSGIALLFALPLGLAISIFLSENFLPLGVRQVVRFVVELLAAIPSVVYGLWGIAVLIPLVIAFGQPVADFLSAHGHGLSIFAGPVHGNSMFTASLVLALMILPTIAAISRAALVSVPGTLREGAYALGCTRWEAIFGVIIPSALPGIVAATILSLGRAMGETMAVAMLIGNSPRLTWSIFQPAGTLSSLLANQFAEADGIRVNALMYAALALMFLTVLVNIAGEAVLRIAQRKTAGIR